MKHINLIMDNETFHRMRTDKASRYLESGNLTWEGYFKLLFKETKRFGIYKRAEQRRENLIERGKVDKNGKQIVSK